MEIISILDLSVTIRCLPNAYRHIELQEEAAQERKNNWIKEKLGNIDADSSTPGLEDWEEEYDRREMLGYFEEYEDYLSVYGKTSYALFNEIIENSNELLTVEVSSRVHRNLLVMLYAHIVAATEAYLSSTFIQKVSSSTEILRKLVESDPEFAARKFSIKEIFIKKETLKDDASAYLKELIFHKIEKVKPMYKDTLGIDFGNVNWLFTAVEKRHHCVHRAGYDKDGNEINISADIVKELSKKCMELVDLIENEIIKLPSGDLPF